MLTVDEHAIVQEAQRLAPAIGERAAPDFWRVNGSNAELMRAERL